MNDLFIRLPQKSHLETTANWKIKPQVEDRLKSILKEVLRDYGFNPDSFEISCLCIECVCRHLDDYIGPSLDDVTVQAYCRFGSKKTITESDAALIEASYRKALKSSGFHQEIDVLISQQHDAEFYLDRKKVQA